MQNSETKWTHRQPFYVDNWTGQSYFHLPMSHVRNLPYQSQTHIDNTKPLCDRCYIPQQSMEMVIRAEARRIKRKEKKARRKAKMQMDKRMRQAKNKILQNRYERYDAICKEILANFPPGFLSNPLWSLETKLELSDTHYFHKHRLISEYIEIFSELFGPFETQATCKYSHADPDSDIYWNLTRYEREGTPQTTIGDSEDRNTPPPPTERAFSPTPSDWEPETPSGPPSSPWIRPVDDPWDLPHSTIYGSAAHTYPTWDSTTADRQGATGPWDETSWAVGEDNWWYDSIRNRWYNRITLDSVEGPKDVNQRNLIYDVSAEPEESATKRPRRRSPSPPEYTPEYSPSTSPPLYPQYLEEEGIEEGEIVDEEEERLQEELYELERLQEEIDDHNYWRRVYEEELALDADDEYNSDDIDEDDFDEIRDGFEAFEEAEIPPHRNLRIPEIEV